LPLLVGRQEGHPACKKTEWWVASVVIRLERDANLHMAQLMPLPLTVSCYSKIQIGFTLLVPAHPDSPGKRAVKQVLNRCSSGHCGNTSMLRLLFFNVLQQSIDVSCQWQQTHHSLLQLANGTDGQTDGHRAISLTLLLILCRQC